MTTPGFEYADGERSEHGSQDETFTIESPPRVRPDWADTAPGRHQGPFPSSPDPVRQRLPVRRKISRLAVAALVLSALDLIGILGQAKGSVDHTDEVARGVGTWGFSLGLAIVAVVLAATGLSRVGRLGKRGRVPAIIALVLASLAIIGSSLHLAALIANSG